MPSPEKPNNSQQDSGWDALAENMPISDVQPPDISPDIKPEEVSSPIIELSNMPSFEEHMREINGPANKNKHTPSRSAAFLKAQAIAKEKGQRMVDDEKRPYIYSHEIEERMAKGEDINSILENTNGDGVWIHVEEFLDNGADVEKVFEYMPKDTRWLRIDELVKHGYDINRLADKMSDTVVWLNADKFVEYGADIERLKQRLSSKDEYLKHLIDKGELFGNQNQ